MTNLKGLNSTPLEIKLVQTFLHCQKWIDSTNAIGIVSKSGRNGGTFAHTDIVFEFASWISAEFKLYIIKDYKRLKNDESSRLSLGWNLNREISKLNYRIHTDAMESYNAILIEQCRPQTERLQLLNKLAIRQLKAIEEIGADVIRKLENKE
jgi:hypothetical protein